MYSSFSAAASVVGSSISLGLLLCGAVTSDLLSHRIPNRLVLSGLALAFGLHLAATFSGQASLAGAHAWSPLTGLLVGGCLLMPLYLLRACGAGDVKLMAMVGAFVGADTALSAVLYTLLAGGLLSLAMMMLRGVATQTLTNIRFIVCDWGLRANSGQGLRLAPLTTTAARLPYAVAIAAGTLAALLWPLALLD